MICVLLQIKLKSFPELRRCCHRPPTCLQSNLMTRARETNKSSKIILVPA